MGRFLKEARRHSAQIERLCDNSSPLDEQPAVQHHYRELSDLLCRAEHSLRHRSDVQLIRELVARADAIVYELRRLRQRECDWRALA
jgi:hypothetical protein